MRKKTKRLSLSRETLRTLQHSRLRGAAGGVTTVGPDCGSKYPLNCNCTDDETSCPCVGGNTCQASNCPSCDISVDIA